MAYKTKWRKRRRVEDLPLYIYYQKRGTNQGRGENTEDKQEHNHKSATEILCDVTYLLSINITYI